MIHNEKEKKLLTGVEDLVVVGVEIKKNNTFFVVAPVENLGQKTSIMMFSNEYAPLVKMLLHIPDDKILEEWDDDDIKNIPFQAEFYISEYKEKKYQKIRNFKLINDTDEIKF